MQSPSGLLPDLGLPAYQSHGFPGLDVLGHSGGKGVVVGRLELLHGDLILTADLPQLRGHLRLLRLEPLPAGNFIHRSPESENLLCLAPGILPERRCS